MRISMSVAVKCKMPPIKNHRNTALRPIRFNIRDAGAFAGGEILGSLFIAAHRCATHPPRNNPDPSSAGARGAGGRQKRCSRGASPAHSGRSHSGFCGSSPSTENTNARVSLAASTTAEGTSRHALTALMALAKPVCKAVSMRASAWVHAATSGASSGMDCRTIRTNTCAACTGLSSAAPSLARIPFPDRARHAVRRAESAAPREYPAAGCRRGRRWLRLPPELARPAPRSW